MAAAQQAVSFNEIIQTSRQKKKNEELANKILGKNRRASAPGSGAGKPQNATLGSLASRIGVTKRSSSAHLGSKNNSRASSAAGRNQTTSSRPARRRRPDEDRLISALNPTSGQATMRNINGGISIKGTGSESFVVVGKNFAPGTTAADIQSAIEPVSGKVVSCWVTSYQPTVTAEITFKEKSSAEKAVANFHNQRADGRLLSIQLKSSSNRDVLDRPTASFNHQREQADRERRSQRTADPMVQDGNFGFDEQISQPSSTSRNSGRGRNQRGSWGRKNFGGGDRKANQALHETGLYSDEMMVDVPPQNPRGRGNRRH